MWADKILKMKDENLRQKEKSIYCDRFMSKRLQFKQRDWTKMQTLKPQKNGKTLTWKNGFCEIWFNGSEKMFQKLKWDWKEEKRNVFNWKE